MARQPLARGRLAYIAESYPSNEIDPHTRQPKMKNRYANLGRVTAWPAENGAPMPQISLDLDALPVGLVGSTKLFIFWEDENKQQAEPQPQSFGSWGNAPHPNQQAAQQPQQQNWPQQPQQPYPNQQPQGRK